MDIHERLDDHEVRIVDLEKTTESLPSMEQKLDDLLTEKIKRESMEKVVITLLKSIPVTIGVCTTLVAAIMWLITHAK